MQRKGILASLAAAVVVVVAGLAGVAAITSGSDGDDAIVVYTARLHYGEEEAFRRFAERTGHDVKLFGGDGPALNERLKAEGELTKADLLITVDGANLAQAVEDGLLRPVESTVLERNVPDDLQDPQNRWFGITTRARTIVRSTESTDAGDLSSYADLGDRRWRGQVCLRTSDSVYNSSFVADRLAKDGRGATASLLRSWMENDPIILGSDVDVLEAIAAGRCDVGLTNHYYLGRMLKDEPDFPVTPVWANQAGHGTHINLSGAGVTRHASNPEGALELLEYLSSPEAQSLFAEANSEFPANPRADLPGQIDDWKGFDTDPMAVRRAGDLQDEAVEVMNEVGWR